MHALKEGSLRPAPGRCQWRVWCGPSRDSSADTSSPALPSNMADANIEQLMLHIIAPLPGGSAVTSSTFVPASTRVPPHLSTHDPFACGTTPTWLWGIDQQKNVESVCSWRSCCSSLSANLPLDENRADGSRTARVQQTPSPSHERCHEGLGQVTHTHTEADCIFSLGGLFST